MKAVVINKFGTADELVEEEIPVPEPEANAVQIEVHACGLNPVDFKIRCGELEALFGARFPRVLGADISGVVSAVGDQVNDLRVGDEVYLSPSLDADGGYAEYCVAPADIVARKPRNLSHVEAASLPVAGLTSVQALKTFGGLKQGQKVLIHAGAGGVGTFAIQYAAAKGADVFTTGRGTKHEFLRSLGAHHAIDYTKEDFVEVSKAWGGMDIVLEAIGGPNYPKSILAAKDGGAVPCIVNPPEADVLQLAEDHKVKTDFLMLQGSRPDLEEISRLVESGTVKPNVSRTFSMTEIQEAHQLLESGRTQGKLVMQIR